MEASPVDVVQRQLEASNRRDSDAFCATFAHHAQIFVASWERAVARLRRGEVSRRS